MIVRILGEGQYDISEVDTLNELDTQLQTAADLDDEAAFEAALGRLLDAVHNYGAPVPEDQISPSELVLPARGTPLAEVRALLGGDGLIPG